MARVTVSLWPTIELTPYPAGDTAPVLQDDVVENLDIEEPPSRERFGP